MLIINPTQWPPDYALKTHQRCKNPLLKITAKGLEIVVPQHKKVNVLQLLEIHRSWIHQHLPATLYRKPIITLPRQIHLHCIEQVWQIHYIQQTSNRINIRNVSPQQLTVRGDIANITACIRGLKRWFIKYAMHLLSERLACLAQSMGLTYSTLTIRQQKTIWGSCSKEKAISLNYQLIFLPAELANYVIRHELCHTIYMDHSAQFWQLLKRYEPNMLQLKKQLKTAQQYLPAVFN